MFDFSYGPVGDLLGPNFTEQMEALKREFAGNPEILNNLERQRELKEKYQRPEGSAEYDFSGDRKQLAQDMADLGFVDNNPMTMQALTSKYSNFLDNLYGVPPISGGQIAGIPGGPGGETAPNRNPDGSPIVGHPEMFDNPPKGVPSTYPTSPMISVDPEESRGPGIETLMPEEEEGYKKYIASDTNPFESMGISSLGQDALRQMIFERNNPQVNQERNYKSYIG